MVPLVGPLEDGLLLVPAMVNEQGPYLFAVDSDAHVSIIDKDVFDETHMRIGEGPKMLDESDTQQVRFYGEVLKWQLGTLTVEGPKAAQIVPAHTFDADGRRIHGVLGRDIIADSLVVSFDRDVGTLTLSTQGAFKPPPTATVLTFSELLSRSNADVLPVPRKLITATINGQRHAMHIDLGMTSSQLRARSWQKDGLQEQPVQIGVVDEVGMIHQVTQKAVAASVSVGGVTTKDVLFLPYQDKRWPDQDLEGTLGLSFFRPYAVSVNWDKSKLYLTPRKDDTSTKVVARLGRWQSKILGSCPNVGCVKAALIDPLAGKPPEQMPAQHPGLVASFTRDASAIKLPLEVLIAVTPAPGKPRLKWLVVNLPAGAERAMTHLPGDYAGATLTVIDASPFPRTCPADGGCVDQLTPPTEIEVKAPAPVQAPAPEPAPAAPTAGSGA